MIKFTKAALVGGATIASIGVLAAAAFAAAPKYHISAGTQKTGTIAYTAAANGSSSKPAIHFTDTTSHQNLTCDSSTAAGKMKLGSAVAAAKAGTITKTTWKNCKALGSLSITTKQVGTWYINGDAASKNGVTKVHVSNVKANITSTFGCKFTVTGSADGSYNNGTGKLSFAPRSGSGHVLKISNASGCSTLAKNGDKATFKGAYLVKTAKGKLKITN